MHFALWLLFAFAVAFGDQGSGIDPDGRRVRALDGIGIDPNGRVTSQEGGHLDPNGVRASGCRGDYTACIDPNG